MTYSFFLYFYKNIKVNNTPTVPKIASVATAFLGISPLLLIALPNIPNTTGWIKNGIANMNEIKAVDSAPNIPPWIDANKPKWEIALEFAIAAYSKLNPAKCNIMNPPKTAINCHPRENKISPLISLPSSLFAFLNVFNAKYVNTIPIKTTSNPGNTYNSPLVAEAAKIVNTNKCPKNGILIITGDLSLATSPISPAVHAPV